MRRAVVASDAMDPLIDLARGLRKRLRRAGDGGDLKILFTHVTVEELAAIPDYERPIVALLIFLIDLGQLVPTGAIILGACHGTALRTRV